MQSSASASPLHQHVIPSTQAVVDKGKRRALDFPSNSSDPADDDDDDDDEWCLICHTHPIVDRTFLPACLHSQFCFVCILRWIDIKRTCPLCLRSIGNFVIHSVRSDDDFLRYHLPPPPLLVRSASTTTASTSRREITTQVQRARTTRVSHTDPLQANVLAFRRFVYRNSLYAHHIGSNPRTGFSAAPTPARIRHDTRHATGEIVTRISTFLRRELSLFPGVDVEFVTKYVVSLTQVWPLPDDSMVKLVAEVLGEEAEEGRARHLLHELECWLRSGRRELSRWDAVVQYGRGGGERWDGLGRRVVGKKRGRDVVELEVERRNRGYAECRRVEKRGRDGGEDGVESSSAGKEGPSSHVRQVQKRDQVDQSGLQEERRDTTQTGLRAEVASRRSTLLDRLERERSLLYRQSS